eukprot:154507-Amphidinium_carterae.1
MEDCIVLMGPDSSKTTHQKMPLQCAHCSRELVRATKVSRHQSTHPSKALIMEFMYPAIVWYLWPWRWLSTCTRLVTSLTREQRRPDMPAPEHLQEAHLPRVQILADVTPACALG